jgi:hypothetical protein
LAIGNCRFRCRRASLQINVFFRAVLCRYCQEIRLRLRRFGQKSGGRTVKNQAAKKVRRAESFRRYSCPNLSAVEYDFAGRLDATGETVLYMDFIAVYAGAPVEAANSLRDRLIDEFPDAEVKRMTARYEVIEQ